MLHSCIQCSQHCYQQTKKYEKIQVDRNQWKHLKHKMCLDHTCEAKTDNAGCVEHPKNQQTKKSHEIKHLLQKSIFYMKHCAVGQCLAGSKSSLQHFKANINIIFFVESYGFWILLEFIEFRWNYGKHIKKYINSSKRGQKLTR